MKDIQNELYLDFKVTPPECPLAPNTWCRTNDFVKEYRNTDQFKVKEYMKLYGKEMKKYEKSINRYNMSIGKEAELLEQGFSKRNLEFYLIAVEAYQAKVLAYECVFDMNDIYCKWVDHLEVMNDCYLTDGERRAHQPKYDEIFAELVIKMKRMEYVMNRKESILKQKMCLEPTTGEWLSVKCRYIFGKVKGESSNVPVVVPKELPVQKIKLEFFPNYSSEIDA